MAATREARKREMIANLDNDAYIKALVEEAYATIFTGSAELECPCPPYQAPSLTSRIPAGYRPATDRAPPLNQPFPLSPTVGHTAAQRGGDLYFNVSVSSLRIFTTVHVTRPYIRRHPAQRPELRSAIFAVG